MTGTWSSTTSTTIRMSWRAFCRLMERVSSVGAVPKTSVRIHDGELGRSYQVTKAAMPFCATMPRAERSSELSRLYQGNDFSSWRRVVVDSWPTLARSFFRVSAFSGVIARELGLRFAGVVVGSGMHRAYGACRASSILCKGYNCGCAESQRGSSPTPADRNERRRRPPPSGGDRRRASRLLAAGRAERV